MSATAYATASAGDGPYSISVTFGTGRCQARDVGPTSEKSGSCALILGIRKNKLRIAMVSIVDRIDFILYIDEAPDNGLRGFHF